MIALQLNILCNKDEREEEDIKLQEQLKEMGVPPSDDAPKVIQEWRMGYIIAEHIEAFYPSGKFPQHTMVHMASNNIITIKENITELLTILTTQSSPTQNTDSHGQRIYNYSATVSGV